MDGPLHAIFQKKNLVNFGARTMISYEVLDYDFQRGFDFQLFHCFKERKKLKLVLIGDFITLFLENCQSSVIK